MKQNSRQLSLKDFPWKLAYAKTKEEANFDDLIPAKVPGNILTDLENAGLIFNPYLGENFRGAAWTEDWTFWYVLDFPGSVFGFEKSTQSLFLRFDGVDTYAEVFFNDVSVGHCQNMFKRHTFPLPKSSIRPGMNRLLVRVDPWKAAATRWADENHISYENLGVAFCVQERVVARKMQMAFGWDNTPRLPVGGIFRDVFVDFRESTWIEDWTWSVVAGSPTEGFVDLVISGKVNHSGWSAQEVLTLEITGSHDESSCHAITEVRADGIFETKMRLLQPHWWWPNGMGESPLYQFSMDLKASGHSYDQKEALIGIRTILIKKEPLTKRRVKHRIGLGANRDLDGGELGPWTKVPLDEEIEVDVSPFECIVNGKKVFLKGANWQPADVRIGTVPDEKNRTLLESAAAAHMNVIRIWGGGTVESDFFYHECSRLGLLVFQDFFFASAEYPRD